MLSDVMLYVVMLYVAMLSVVLPNVVMLGAEGPRDSSKEINILNSLSSHPISSDIKDQEHLAF